ncbi:Protein of unknown function [Jatrophihabitans endophyticus]|uniref:DUF4235 domain-containing protein n=1 Tax=Jatrophihabitans endophyticus TaxID=1206085 RepID=A0A1M5SNW2_9ACTN|nr:DUF4235 domain-containing protein [Jatrophihabitans endophyticus]SHH40195.1 Protein of unknown function [Jatrophihabitans endophyticus]
MALGAKITMKLITVSISVPVTMATKKAVEKTWLAVRPDDPPRKAKDADVTWADALAWAALSAAGLVVADLVSRRGAESVYRTLTGSEPPAKASKSPKKLKEAKTQERIAKGAPAR